MIKQTQIFSLCLLDLLIDSNLRCKNFYKVVKNCKNYYLQKLLEERKYVVKQRRMTKKMRQVR